MLFDIAIGDAYGLGFEFAEPEKFKFNDLSAYLPHGLHPIKPGCYSDDAQMSLAVSEVLLQRGPEAAAADFADAFVRAFRRDPRLGYARGFHAILSEVADGQELVARINPTSTRGGAAMRACPIGMLRDVDDVKRIAEVQARVTHDTHQGVTSAIAVALMVHAGFHLRIQREDLREYLVEELGDEWAQPYTDYVKEDGILIANAALSAVEGARSNSQTEILKAAVSYMGDTDTVAAIAMGVSSILVDCDRLIPHTLVYGLENGPYGRDYLAAIDQQLYQRFPWDEALSPSI